MASAKRQHPLVLWTEHEIAQGWRASPDNYRKRVKTRDMHPDALWRGVSQMYGLNHGH